MKGARGFTLVELVLAILLLGVFGTVLAVGLPVAVEAYDLVWARRMVLAQAQSGMERMVSEMELIPGSAQVTTTLASNFQFQYPAGTSISYALSGGDLMRNSDVLIDDVSALTFTYYDEAGVATSTAASVRQVSVEFTVDSPGEISNFTLRTRVFLRNTGNGYANFASP